LGGDHDPGLVRLFEHDDGRHDRRGIGDGIPDRDGGYIGRGIAKVVGGKTLSLGVVGDYFLKAWCASWLPLVVSSRARLGIERNKAGDFGRRPCR